MSYVYKNYYSVGHSSLKQKPKPIHDHPTVTLCVKICSLFDDKVIGSLYFDECRQGTCVPRFMKISQLVFQLSDRQTSIVSSS